MLLPKHKNLPAKLLKEINMSDAIHVEIVSPEKLVFSAEVKSVSIPGIEGYFTIMGDHAPLMSILKPGFVNVVGDKEGSYFVGGGFADVSNNSVTILAEKASSASEFDIAEIEQSIAEAEKLLAEAKTPLEKNEAQALIDGWRNFATIARNKN